MNNKMALNEEIVKNIFPATMPEIALGEDGYVIYDFKKLYPSKLGIFIPNEVDRSNYSSAFPRQFDSYFADIYDEAAYMSRLLEVEIRVNLRNVGAQCMPIKVLKSAPRENYLVFRFDELLRSERKTELLCRAKLKDLNLQDKEDILGTAPIFMAEADSFTGDKLLYWITPVSHLFEIGDEVLAAAFAFANALRSKNGPF